MIVDSVATLKNISGSDRFNGLALIVFDKKAWYIYDSGSSLAADDNIVILPNDSVGRWVMLNQNANIFNNYNVQIATSSNTILDNTNFDLLELRLNQSTAINFATSLRNGMTTLVLTRSSNSYLITGWDNRIQWGSLVSYTFPNQVNKAIITFCVFSNLLYVSSINEFTE